MKDAFPGPSSVALLVNTVVPGIPSAGFFFWSGNDIDRKQSKLVFPFDGQALREAGSVRTEPVAAPAPARTALNIPPWQALTAAGLAAVAGFGIVSASTRNSGKPVETPSAVVQPAPAPANAGETPWRQAPVTGGTSQDAAGDGSADQPVRPIYVPDERSGAIPAPAPYTPPAAPVSAAPVADAPVATAPVPAPVQQPAASLQPSGSLPGTVQPPASVPATAPVQEASHADAPAGSTAPTPVRRRPTVLVAVSMEPQESSETKSAELKKLVGRVPLVGHVPVLGKWTNSHGELASNFQPARPNSALRPRVPQEMAASLWHELPVDVKVSIDRNGVVRNTEVLSGGHTSFSSLAADNAFWTAWQPARLGEQAVPSEMILHYRFRPTSPAQQ